MPYSGVLEAEADGGFVAWVAELPGCVSQGDSREEALANIREAMALYVADCRAAGDEVPCGLSGDGLLSKETTDAGGGPRGDATAEEVGVFGPDRTAEGEGGGEDGPVFGISRT